MSHAASRPSAAVLGWLVGIALALRAAAADAGPLEFFTWAPRSAPGVDRALALYESGRALRAAAAASRALADRDEAPFREELLLVRALALAEAGWSEEADAALGEILDLPEPSPYYPLALLALVDLRHGEGRFEDVARACGSYWRDPRLGSTHRDSWVRSYLDAYGEVRDGGALTENERDLLAHPARLAEGIPLRKERPSERLLYLCGLDLLRLGRVRESLDCFDRIGVPSLYYPWALYAAAQDLYAADEIEHALELLARLRRLPPAGAAESELAARAGLLRMQMLFDAGRTDEAAQSAREIARGGRSALAARLLRAEIALVDESPSLAIALFGDLDRQRLDAPLDAERSLGLADAYARLGDPGSAVAHLRTAAGRLARDRARLEPPNARAEVARLIGSVTADAASLRAEAAGQRKQIVLGIRRVLAVRGPMNLGKLARIVVTPHRSSIVGRAVYDLSGLSKSEPRSPALTVGAGDARAAYLRSPRRHSIEAATAVRLDIEAAPEAETALPVVSALLGLLDGRFEGGREARDAVVRMLGGIESALGADGGEVVATDHGAPLASRLRALRVRLLASLGPHAEAPVLAGDLLAAARRQALDGLDAAIADGLRQVVAAEAQELRGAEFEVDSALSDAMLRQNAAARSRGAGP